MHMEALTSSLTSQKWTGHGALGEESELPSPLLTREKPTETIFFTQYLQEQLRVKRNNQVYQVSLHSKNDKWT